MVRALAVVVAMGLTAPAQAGSWGKDDDGGWATSAAVDGKRYSVGTPVVAGDLAVYPVIDREASAGEADSTLPLSDALPAGLVSVREVRGGVVSTLAMVNTSDEPVLARAGDVLHGGMQDRVLVQEVVIPPGARPVAVRVHCVERGRWTGGQLAGRFVYGGRVDPSVLAVIQSHQDQSATWSAIAARNRTLGVAGDASWLASAGVDPVELGALDAEVRARFDDKRVVGVLVRHGDQLVGRELYDSPTAFASDRTNVLRSQLAGAVVARARIEGVSAAATGLAAAPSTGSRTLAQSDD